MKLMSINVGLPRQVEWHGETVTTAIFKLPVAGVVTVKTLNLEGDCQGDLTVHGGERKAVYAYPIEHYEYWRAELPDKKLTHGAFGENLTTSGLLETEVGPGDLLEIGTAAFTITVPRMPCYKLQVRFDRMDIVQRFMDSGRTGFYAAIALEGDVAAGDALEVLQAGEGRTIADVVDVKRRRA